MKPVSAEQLRSLWISIGKRSYKVGTSGNSPIAACASMNDGFQRRAFTGDLRDRQPLKDLGSKPGGRLKRTGSRLAFAQD